MNITAEQANGIVRCECGCKYWNENTDGTKITCADCGEKVAS
jgi:hypothetical protein